jgi:hypothetical protein
MTMTLRFAMTIPLMLAAACSGNGMTGTGTTGTGAGGGTGGTGGTGGGACAKAPASGFTEMIPPSDGQVGAFTAATQDENGDPLVAYVWDDPMGQTADKSTLHFMRWDRCAGAFTAPVTIDTVGDQGFSQPERGVGISYDAAAKKLAVVYQRTDFPPGVNPVVRIYLVTSTDMGKTWSPPARVNQVLPQGDEVSGATAPAVALKGNDVWVAYAHANYMCCTACGSCMGEWIGHSTDGGGTFSYDIVKVGGDVAQPAAYQSELRLDATGAPGLVYIANDDVQPYNRRIVYTKAGAPGSAVVVFDSQNTQNDDPSAALAYDGVKPRVVAHLVADSLDTYDMRFSSSDDGVTWTAPLPLPRDGHDTTAWFESLAIDSKGGAAIAAYVAGGQGDSICGGPRVLRSADLKAWTACGADKTKMVAVQGSWVQAYFAPGDKLSIVTTGTLMSENNKTGLLFWREP